MYRQGSRRTSRNLGVFMDLLHIIIGILIVVLAVIAFLNPEKNLILFPFIFLLAAVLNLANGWVKLEYSGRDKKKKAGGLAIMALGAALVVLSIISGISIWR